MTVVVVVAVAACKTRPSYCTKYYLSSCMYVVCTCMYYYMYVCMCVMCDVHTEVCTLKKCTHTFPLKQVYST